MREQTEIIFAVSADDIEKTKVRADLGISYDMEVLRLIDDITQMGIAVNSVVITKYTGQTAADGFAQKLTTRGVKNYIHRPLKGYPQTSTTSALTRDTARTRISRRQSPLWW